MKNRILAAAGLAVVLAAPGFAQEGPYITGGVGYGWVPDTSVDRVVGLDGDVQAEGDWRFMLGAGYAFANNFRVQFDVMDRYNDTGAVGNVNPGNSDFQNVAAMLSGIYDFNRAGRFSPYAGLGIGLSETDFSAWYPDGQRVDQGDRGLSYQALLGLGIDLSDNVTADIEYRYFYGTDVSFTTTPGGIPGSTDNYTSHDVLFGLRYHFSRPPAPQLPDDPPEVPAVTCADVPFVVYFEWDRADLTSQAQEVIARAADQASSCAVTRVEIEGHADRSGAATYNVRLSERRARVVRDELIRLGVPAELISIEARGESEPAVATPDGAREPLNRRAEVVIRVEG